MATVNEQIEESFERRLDVGGMEPFSVVPHTYSDVKQDMYELRALYWFQEALDRESQAQSAEDMELWNTAKRHREAATLALRFADKFGAMSERR